MWSRTRTGCRSSRACCCGRWSTTYTGWTPVTGRGCSSCTGPATAPAPRRPGRWTCRRRWAARSLGGSRWPMGRRPGCWRRSRGSGRTRCGSGRPARDPNRRGTTGCSAGTARPPPGSTPPVTRPVCRRGGSMCWTRWAGRTRKCWTGSPRTTGPGSPSWSPPRGSGWPGGRWTPASATATCRWTTCTSTATGWCSTTWTGPAPGRARRTWPGSRQPTGSARSSADTARCGFGDADLAAVPWLGAVDLVGNLHFHLVDKPRLRGTESWQEGWLDRTLAALRSSAATLLR